MTLSIVIPCFNEEELLGACLNSISTQTVLPDEVVFVDNNSRDSSRAIAKGHIPKFKKVGVHLKIVSAITQGIVPARIEGFRLAQGDLVATIDVDSFLNPNWVKTAKTIFRKSHVVAASGPYFARNPSLAYVLDRIGIPHLIPPFYPSIRCIYGCNGVFLKSAYLKVGGLENYDQIHTNLRLKYTYDDMYLSVKLRQIGQIGYAWGLRVSRRSTENLTRILNQPQSIIRITREVHRPI